MLLPDFIEIETSRYCNRRCPWCPNGPMAFRTEQELMPWDLFERLILQLADHRFSGWIALHNYNEPLANPRLVTELAFIAGRLRHSKPSIFTNGDLLNSEMVRALCNAGVSYLRVMRYPPLSQAMAAQSDHQIADWLDHKNILTICDWKVCPVRQGCAAFGEIQQMKIEVIVPNISLYNWRGGTTSIPLGCERTLPCSLTTRSAAIDFAGRLKMCCNVYPEAPDHANYVIGSLNTHSFAELWESSVMEKFRYAHVRSDWSVSPICSRCTQTLPRDFPTVVD